MRKTAYLVEDVARMCRVSTATVRRWMEEEGLSSFHEGPDDRRRVWDEDLLRFLRDHRIWTPEELAGVRGPRFLIIDDEPDARAMMSRLLRSVYEAAEVWETGDGFEAGHRVANVRPSLVVLDLRLPGLDGFKVCRTLRADDSLRATRILVVSGFREEDVQRRILAEGADAFLAKPFRSQDFVEKVRSLVS